MTIGPDQTQSVLNKMENAESDAFGEKELSFEERIEKAMAKVEEIVKFAEIYNRAKDIAEGHSVTVLKRMQETDEKRLIKLCEPYDAATIIALCIYFEEESKKVKDAH